MAGPTEEIKQEVRHENACIPTIKTQRILIRRAIPREAYSARAYKVNSFVTKKVYFNK